MKTRFFTTSIIAALALVPLGFWHAMSAQPAISGRVTLDGRPLENAFVFYTSEPGASSNLSRFTRTDATGQYTLDQADPLPPGRYRIIVRAPGRADEDATLDDSVQWEAMAASGQSHRSEGPVTDHAQDHSVLTVEVDEKGRAFSEVLLFSGYQTAVAEQTSRHQ